MKDTKDVFYVYTPSYYFLCPKLKQFIFAFEGKHSTSIIDLFSHFWVLPHGIFIQSSKLIQKKEKKRKQWNIMSIILFTTFL